MTFELVGMLSLWILWVFFSIRFCCSHPWSLSFFQPCIYESTIKANTLIYFGVLMVIIVTLLYGCFDWDKNVTLVETEKKFVSRFFRVFFSYYKYYCQYFISYHGVMRAFLSFSHWAYPLTAIVQADLNLILKWPAGLCIWVSIIGLCFLILFSLKRPVQSFWQLIIPRFLHQFLDPFPSFMIPT